MKFILIPDSFKGTLSSVEICNIIKEKISIHFPDSEVAAIPVADGGEGSVDAFLAAVGGEKKYVTVKNPYFEDMDAYYGLLSDGETAVVEMAACAGLPLVEDRKNPRLTTTYGVGQLILAAAKAGAKKIVIGLGGSCTNDGGCGAAAAAGVRFYNGKDEVFIPTGGTLDSISRISMDEVGPILKGVEIVTMCDIDNPMYGETGAAYIFGPQKGADEKMVKELDEGLKLLSAAIENTIGKNVSKIPGAGAAGAMGAGMVAFFNSELQMGIETVLDTVKFDELLSHDSYVLTGEGKLDSQSLRGKVVIGIAGRTKKHDVPLIAIVGGAEDEEISRAYEMGVTAVFPINRLPQDFSVSSKFSKENLGYTVDNVLRLLKI